MHTNTVERETETDRVLRFLTSHQASRIPSWLQKETDTKRQTKWEKDRGWESERKTRREGAYTPYTGYICTVSLAIPLARKLHPVLQWPPFSADLAGDTVLALCRHHHGCFPQPHPLFSIVLQEAATTGTAVLLEPENWHTGQQRTALHDLQCCSRPGSHYQS